VLSQADLPLPADENSKWEWLYACQWQCLHSRGYWELRSVSGGYWECTSSHTQNVMLKGIDMSWVVPNTSSRRRAEAPERTPVLIVVLACVAVPVLLCMCAVVLWLMQACKGNRSEEEKPLLDP